eukprot:2842960-Pyramimonas_sp.AAC.1
MHGSGATKETRYVFTTVPKSWMHSKAVLDVVFTRLAWAFNALCDGKLPMTDWQGASMAGGRTLAQGWRLAVIFCGGDWEFYSSHCGFPTGQSVPNNCWMCRASPLEGPLNCYH